MTRREILAPIAIPIAVPVAVGIMRSFRLRIHQTLAMDGESVSGMVVLVHVAAGARVGGRPVARET